jgi:hypothetical protein
LFVHRLRHRVHAQGKRRSAPPAINSKIFRVVSMLGSLIAGRYEAGCAEE